ncbi:MAG: hypothetical protein IK147_02255 [Clostridia bacterium]|nr:hypothetical protein [Clostridia bacterium]
MKLKKYKILLFLLAAVLLLFFSNDFGLIDVEKTAIITAVAVDKDGDRYKVTAQIAVPEATDVNAENQRAQIYGTGGTVGAAIKNIGDTSGWFPQLAFCNLIILGENLADTDLVRVLDYFSKTLRMQDSALTVMSEGNAADILKLSTPLDHISSFALQKILLKNAGLNRDIAHCDVKTFCLNYYSVSESSYMPYIKVVSQKRENSENENGGGGGGDSQAQGGVKGTDIFNADTTAIFLKGRKVGLLSDKQTLAFNAISGNFSSTTVEVDDITPLTEENDNCLLTVLKSRSKTYLTFVGGDPVYNVELDLFVKVSDRNSAGADSEYLKNLPLPVNVKEKAESDIYGYIESLIEVSKSLGCDFLGVKKELYRRHYGKYSVYKDDILNTMRYSIKVNVHGEK